MRALFLSLLLLLAAACNNGVASPTASSPVATPPMPAASPTVDKPTKESLYAECKERVEMPQKAGECKTDADCAKAGCSKEVCTTTTDAKGWMTACDKKHCFQALDDCGCHDGVCSWTLKDPGPPPPPNKLPPM